MLEFFDQMAFLAHAALAVLGEPSGLDNFKIFINFSFLWFFGIIIVEDYHVGHAVLREHKEPVTDEVVDDGI